MTSLLSKLTEGCAVCVYAPEDGLYLSEVCPRQMLITFLLLFSHVPAMRTHTLCACGYQRDVDL